MKQKYFYLILFVTLIFRIVISPIFYHPDVNNHIDWGERFFEYGPSKIYDHSSNIWSYTWPNQPPGTMYIFAFMHKIYQLIFSFLWFLNIKIQIFPSFIMPFFEFDFKYVIVKLPAIFADLGVAVLIYKIIVFFKSKNIAAQTAAIFYLFNPAIWYNSTVWGQTDSIISFVFLLGLYFILNKKLFRALIFFALSIYIKISLLIFIPVVAIYIVKNYKTLNIFVNVIFVLFFVGLITLPFSLNNSNPYSYLLFIYNQRVLTQQLQHLNG